MASLNNRDFRSAIQNLSATYKKTTIAGDLTVTGSVTGVTSQLADVTERLEAAETEINAIVTDVNAIVTDVTAVESAVGTLATKTTGISYTPTTTTITGNLTITGTLSNAWITSAEARLYDLENNAWLSELGDRVKDLENETAGYSASITSLILGAAVMEGQISANSTAIAGVSGTVAGVAADLTALTTTVNGHTSELLFIDESITSLETSVAGHETRLGTAEGTITALVLSSTDISYTTFDQMTRVANAFRSGGTMIAGSNIVQEAGTAELLSTTLQDVVIGGGGFAPFSAFAAMAFEGPMLMDAPVVDPDIMTVNGNSTMNGNLVVTGTFTNTALEDRITTLETSSSSDESRLADLETKTTAITYASPTTSISGDLSVGTVSASGGFTGTSATLSGALQSASASVTGNATVGGDVLVTGALKAGGEISLVDTGGVVKGKTLISGNAYVCSSTAGSGWSFTNATDQQVMSVTNGGTMTVSSGYRVGSNTVLSAGVLGSTITSSSLTSVGTLGSLTVSGALSGSSATLSGALQSATAAIVGNTTVGGTLGVTGALSGGEATFSGALQSASANVTGNTTVGGNLVVTGTLTAGGISDFVSAITALQQKTQNQSASADYTSFSGKIDVGGCQIQSSKKDVNTLSGCTTIDPNETQWFFDYSFTAVSQYGYSFGASSQMASYESWRAFGNDGRWHSGNNFSDVTGNYLGASTIVSSGTTYSAEWVAANMPACRVNRIVYSIKRVASSGSTVKQYLISLKDSTTGTYTTLALLTNGSNADVDNLSVTCNLTGKYDQVRFNAISAHTTLGTLARVSFSGIKVYGYTDAATQVYVPTKLEIGRPSHVVPSSIATETLTVNGNISVQDHVFRKVYAFEATAGSGSVPAGYCYCGYGTVSYLKDDYNMFSTPGSGFQAPRSGWYSISINGRLADTSATVSLLPRIITNVGVVVKNLSAYFVASDGSASYRRSLTWSSVVYMNATEYFQPIAQYAVSHFGWTFSACYLGD